MLIESEELLEALGKNKEAILSDETLNCIYKKGVLDGLSLVREKILFIEVKKELEKLSNSARPANQ